MVYHVVYRKEQGLQVDFLKPLILLVGDARFERAAFSSGDGK
jgi:hypothetical protein